VRSAQGVGAPIGRNIELCSIEQGKESATTTLIQQSNLPTMRDRSQNSPAVANIKAQGDACCVNGSHARRLEGRDVSTQTRRKL
jgi:hypothetical protein